MDTDKRGTRGTGSKKGTIWIGRRKGRRVGRWEREELGEQGTRKGRGEQGRQGDRVGGETGR